MVKASTIFGIKKSGTEENNPTAETEETEMADETVAMVPWIEARKNPETLKAVITRKTWVSNELRAWGQKHGISDLSLQHIMTMAKNPDAKISYYWNPDKLEWFRYRDGDEVPRWLLSLTNRKSYKYPDGSALTDEMKAKFKGRVGSKEKVTSLD